MMLSYIIQAQPKIKRVAGGHRALRPSVGPPNYTPVCTTHKLKISINSAMTQGSSKK